MCKVGTQHKPIYLENVSTVRKIQGEPWKQPVKGPV